MQAPLPLLHREMYDTFFSQLVNIEHNIERVQIAPNWFDACLWVPSNSPAKCEADRRNGSCYM